MNDSQRKYLQRCIKSRILGNRLEMKSRCKGRAYQMIDRIVNDYRFFSVLDFRREWIVYATTRIEALIDSVGVEDRNDDSGWLNQLNVFVQEWFKEHFGKDVEFVAERRASIAKSKSLLKSNGEADNNDEDDDDDSDEDDFPWLCREYNFSNNLLTKDETKFDTDSQDNSMPQSAAGDAGENISTTDEQYLNTIDKSIVKLALRLGRVGSLPIYQTTSKFSRSSHSDISGVTIGDNLNAMLPVETALLGERATENVFFRRFVEKRLQVFASASMSSNKGQQKKGPIIVCVDTSSSMAGEPEEMAKMLAQAVAIVAQRTHRTLCVINYSCQVRYFVLTNWARQRDAFLNFLSKSYGGGNDENLLFAFVFQSLLKGQRYKHLKEKLAGADLLVISDYQWGFLAKNIKKLIEASCANGMKLYSLEIGMCDDRFDVISSASEFYLEQCECRYKSVNGKCVGYKKH